MNTFFKRLAVALVFCASFGLASAQTPGGGGSHGGGGGTGCNTAGSSGSILTDDGAGGCADNTTDSGALAGLAHALNGSSGLLAFSKIGTSGATLGLLNANKTDSGNDIFSGTLKFTGLNSGTPVSYIGLDSGNNAVLGSPSGGGSLTTTDSLSHTVTNTASLAFGPGFVLSGSGGAATVNLGVIDTTKTASYTVVAGDMANALNLAATTGTPALTLPTASTTIFAPGMTLSITVAGTVPWTLTNSTGLTSHGLNSTTLQPGTAGTLVANADGATLDFFPGTQPPAAAVIGGVLAKDCTAVGAGDFVQKINTDGSITCSAPAGGGSLTITDGTNTKTGITTITIVGGVVSGTSPSATITFSGGSGISCPTGFTVVNASCAWTQTASNSGSLAWTGLTLSEYTLRCRNLIGASGSPVFAVQVGEGGTPTYQTGANYSYAQSVTYSGSGGAALASTSASQNGLFAGGAATSGTLGAGFTANLHGLAVSGVTKVAEGNLFPVVSGNVAAVTQTSTFDLDTNVITALRVIDVQGTPGNITSGVCTLYAIAP